MLFSTEYTATVEGSVVRYERCESCGGPYSYLLARTGTGTDRAFLFLTDSKAKALAKARANLADRLEREHDDVPCSACGWHQTRAVTIIRRNSYSGMKNLAGAFFVLAGVGLGILLGILGVILAGSNPELPSATSVIECAAVLLAIAAPGVLLRGLRSLLLLAYRPNG